LVYFDLWIFQYVNMLNMLGMSNMSNMSNMLHQHTGAT
jgi:hypothetical protein